MIDIGGHSLIRAAVKNYLKTLIVILWIIQIYKKST